MEFTVGDIIHFQSEIAGKAKFHFCFFLNEEAGIYSLMFLNSEDEYEDHFVIDCVRIPGLPASRTGKTIFSCPTIIRKKYDQLAKLKPRRKCRLPKDVAADFHEFAQTIRSMTVNDKARLIATLKMIITE